MPFRKELEDEEAKLEESFLELEVLEELVEESERREVTTSGSRSSSGSRLRVLVGGGELRVVLLRVLDFGLVVLVLLLLLRVLATVFFEEVGALGGVYFLELVLLLLAELRLFFVGDTGAGGWLRVCGAGVGGYLYPEGGCVGAGGR